MAEKIHTRRSFTKESKLKVVQFFYENDKNCNQTATNFKVDRKQVGIGILFIEIPTFIILFIIAIPNSLPAKHFMFRTHIFLVNPSNSNFFPITVT